MCTSRRLVVAFIDERTVFERTVPPRTRHVAKRFDYNVISGNGGKHAGDSQSQVAWRLLPSSYWSLSISNANRARAWKRWTACITLRQQGHPNDVIKCLEMPLVATLPSSCAPLLGFTEHQSNISLGGIATVTM